jgi:glycosyltransferase involved in cell wall biosynthesis
MRKVVVVIAYFNREQQLVKTIKSICESEHNDTEVVVVDDASSRPPYVGADILHHIRIEPEEKVWTCPVIPYNMGIKYALDLGAEIVIIQNAECYHWGDVCTYADVHLADNNYISFACWNESSGCTDLLAEIAQDDPFRTDGGTTGWYNHPKWNPRAFHFCNAYNAEDMRQLNGFDERFKDGAGYDDNDLVRRLQALGRPILFTDETQPFVAHQAHDRSHINQTLYQKNHVLYGSIMQEPGYRAQHIVTEDFS